MPASEVSPEPDALCPLAGDGLLAVGTFPVWLPSGAAEPAALDVHAAKPAASVSNTGANRAERLTVVSKFPAFLPGIYWNSHIHDRAQPPAGDPDQRGAVTVNAAGLKCCLLPPGAQVPRSG
jgi:hypothetical protein